MIQKIDLSPVFHKITRAQQCVLIVFKTPRRTHLPSINTLACSKAEIKSLCLKIWTFPTLCRITQA